MCKQVCRNPRSACAQSSACTECWPGVHRSLCHLLRRNGGWEAAVTGVAVHGARRACSAQRHVRVLRPPAPARTARWQAGAGCNLYCMQCHSVHRTGCQRRVLWLQRLALADAAAVQRQSASSAVIFGICRHSQASITRCTDQEAALHACRCGCADEAQHRSRGAQTCRPGSGQIPHCTCRSSSPHSSVRRRGGACALGALCHTPACTLTA